MAKETIIKITDDIDGSEDARTVKFGFDGDQYEIDLNESHYGELKDFLDRFIKAGTKTSSGKTQRASSPAKATREELQRIRAWAKEQGMTVNDRGRISQAVQDAYHQAH
jgi:hypothetical protein